MEQLANWLLRTGMSEDAALIAARAILCVLMVVAAYVANFEGELTFSERILPFTGVSWNCVSRRCERKISED